MIMKLNRIAVVNTTVEKVLNWYTGVNIMSPEFKNAVYEHILSLTNTSIDDADELTDILRHVAKDIVAVETGKETSHKDFESYYIKFTTVNYKNNDLLEIMLYTASLFK